MERSEKIELTLFTQLPSLLVGRGVGKIICEAGKSEHGLTVVPMYHQGLEDLMPHTKSNQLISFLPRVGKRVWAIVGDPVEIDDLVQKARNCKGDDCLKIYEQVADRIAVAIRLLRSGNPLAFRNPFPLRSNNKNSSLSPLPTEMHFQMVSFLTKKTHILNIIPFLPPKKYRRPKKNY